MSPAARLKAILGGAAGNLVEWFDWFAYATFSLYFAKVFFPKGDLTAQLLQTSSVFALGFLARPVGAWLMGLYADRAGRKAALLACVALMCLGSLIVAAVPGYKTIGVAAPIILTVARLIQGLSVGGEYGASATYLSEVAGHSRRGFWSSFQFFTIVGGQVGAMALLMLLQATLTKADLDAWGWRIPFVVGAVLAVAVYGVQRRLAETASFETARARGAGRSTTWRLLSEHPRETLIVFTLSSAGGLTFYALTTYMQKFLINTAHFNRDAATQISAVSLIFYMLVIPLFGWLGDKVGRRRLLIFSFGFGALIAWPMMTHLSVARDAGAALALICGGITVLAGYSAVSAVVKAELFPTDLRGLGVALPYALGNMLFGGTAEFIALWFKQQGHEGLFFIYLAVVQTAAFVAAVLMQDTQHSGRLSDD